MGLALPHEDIDPVPGLKVFARKRILAGFREILSPVPPVVSPPCVPLAIDEEWRVDNFVFHREIVWSRGPFILQGGVQDVLGNPSVGVGFVITTI